LPVPIQNSASLLPAVASLAASLSQANDIPSLQVIHAQAVVLEEATKQFKVAFDQVVRIAILRLETERKIGAELAQTVHRGGHGSNLHSVSSKTGGSSAGLPDGINGAMSSRYRALARIPEDVFQLYLAHASEKERVPSARGLMSFAATERKSASTKPRKKKTTKQAVPAMEMPEEVIAAVRRCIDVEVCVGGKEGVFKGATRLDAETLKPKQLKGDVFVADCPMPEDWLLKLAEARLKGGVQQVIVALPGTPFEPWFRAIEDGKWICCFVRLGNTPLIIAYNGRAKHGFWNAMRELGPVMHAGDHEA
jgi:hypothetical protein